MITTTQSTGLDYYSFVSWVSAYEETYGPLPEIWFTDTAGAVNTEALARYRNSGQVWAEWNCSPVPGDGDDLIPVRTIR